ncbi:MAG: glycosyltransferase family 4 protein [Prevotella sp.]|jgi:glycosyltransferase involved in cell wall biosynthesis
MKKKKLIRITTSDISLDSLIKGQLRFMNQYFEVIGVSNNTGVLKSVGRREGVRVIEVPMHREISLKADFSCLWKLYKLFREERPDIIHANTPKGSLLSMMAGKIAGVKHRVYTVTGLRYQGAKGLFRWILMMMERVTCACATKVIPEGEGVLHTLQMDHITSKPLQVLHHGNINGIDTTYYSYEALQTANYTNFTNDGETTNYTDCTNLKSEATIRGISAIRSNPENADDVIRSLRRNLGFTDKDFVFVFVGRIVKDKGINELTRCMQKLTTNYSEDETGRASCTPKLLLVGSFDNDDPIEASNAIFLKSSPDVKAVGWQEDVRPFLAAADVLVFPSYREGFPNAPIQAGAFGLPSIVTKINGCDEIIQNGVNGKIIPAALTSGSEVMENALFHAMKWFMEHPEEVKKMSRNCRELITSRYEQKDVWAATLRMYQTL